MERFLYRLSVSAHAEKFVLKGALMMTVWGASSKRPTRDIDLLGPLPNRVKDLGCVFRDGQSRQIATLDHLKQGQQRSWFVLLRGPPARGQIWHGIGACPISGRLHHLD